MALQSNLTTYVMRLTPGQELKSTLQTFCQENNLTAPFIMTCVGSVSKVTVRMAKPNSPMGSSTMTFSKNFEIVSLVGTLGGSGHLHISLSDEIGNVIGGHLIGDAIIYTTAEVVIGECTDLTFTREKDDTTGFDELVINSKLKQE